MNDVMVDLGALWLDDAAYYQTRAEVWARSAMDSTDDIQGRIFAQHVAARMYRLAREAVDWADRYKAV